MAIQIEETAIPTDVKPDVSPQLEGQGYTPEFPDSTPEAPYGFKPDGSKRLRRPKGTGKGSTPKGTGTTARRMPASEPQARAAAGLLARMNALVGLALTTSNMTNSAVALAEANTQFEEMAYQALLTDPALCRKILGAGATSGKTALLMAYGMLAMSMIPAARTDIQTKRAERMIEDDD